MQFCRFFTVLAFMMGDVGMQVTVLASGSKGNATLVALDGVRLLVDAGISATRIRRGLAAAGVEAADLDGVLLTHEHRDHIAGLAMLEKWYHLPVYSRAATLASLSCWRDLPAECLHPLGDCLQLGSVQVLPFSTSHDAADPVGYRICGSQCCAIATDLGFVTPVVQAGIEGADTLVLEANHDPDMLRQGAYPWPLKRRILSNRGHLTNADAAWTLVRMQKRPAHVLLAHLSEENNRPELAAQTVGSILQEQGLALDVRVTSQHAAVGVAN